MEIILMRHGKPSLVGPSKIKSSEIPTWVEEYDLSNIGRDVPPESLKPLLLNVSRVLSASWLMSPKILAYLLSVYPSVEDDCANHHNFIIRQ